MKRKSVASALALAVLVSLQLAACGDAPAGVTDASAVATAIRTEVVESRRVTPSLEIPGVVEARSRISLAFRVAGFVERFHVDEGDRVAAGAVLAELDAADFTREVRASRATLARTRAHARDAATSFARQQQLRASGTASEQAYEKAESAHQMAQAEVIESSMRLEQAEDRLAKSTLRAPVSGAIERRLLEPHEATSAETPVLVLTELDTVTVRAAVADNFVGQLRIGGSARVRSPLRPEEPLQGKIVRIGVSADAATRTLPFEVEIDNAAGTLIPELVVTVEISTGEPRDLLLIPLASVLRDSDTRPFCFLASANGPGDGLRAERRRVTIGVVRGDRIAIESGLQPGDRIVTRGQHFLRDGDLVNSIED